MFWNWFGFGRDRDSKRLLFAYRDGSSTRRADPVVVELSLVAVLGKDWRNTIRKLDKSSASFGLVGEQAEAAEAEWFDTRAKVLEAIDAAFGVRAFAYSDGKASGLTDAERWGLLEGYLRFCTDLITAARPFPSAQPRASPSPGNPPPAKTPESTSAATPSPAGAPAN